MKLQAREYKVVVGGLVAVVLFVILQFVILPQLGQENSSASTLFQAQEELRKGRELIAANQLHAQEVALRARLEQEDRRLVTAADANQAGAQFQTWLAAAAAQQQLNLVRSEFLTPAPFGDKYLRIPVRLELSGRITEIAQFLASVTSTDRLVSIDELDLNSSADKQKQVRCGLVVAALMAKPK